jgi:glycosyltransferase involved in cell wall biosynthesis
MQKKSIFLRAWRPMLIRMRVEFHASTSFEASDIAAIFPSSSIIVASDQIRPPLGALGNKPTSNVLRLVYLGRIAPMKRVDVALQAVNLCGLPVSFDIYGPIEDPEHWSMCQQIIRGASANTHITYHGELAHDRVAEVLAQFDALILPTMGENFGHVIAESLAAGCPVICSDRTPWTTVLVSGAGEVVQGFNAEDWAEVLQAWASMTPNDRWQRKLRTQEAYEAWRAAQNGLNVIDAVATRHRAVGNA